MDGKTDINIHGQLLIRPREEHSNNRRNTYIAQSALLNSTAKQK